MIRSVGFKPVTALVEVKGDDTLRLSYELVRAVNELNTVVVTENKVPLRLLEFEQNRKFGMGEFITADDIANMRNVMKFEDVVRRSKTAWVSPTPGGYFGSVVTTKACSPQGRGGTVSILLNGANAGSNLSMLPPADQIAGMEIYPTPLSIPLKYKMALRTACGLLIVWTK